VLDANHGYRVVSWLSRTGVSTDPSIVQSWEADYGGREDCIPQSIICDHNVQWANTAAAVAATVKTIPAGRGFAGPLVKAHREMKITAFDPGEVDAGIFELDALHIPPGTPMYDLRKQ
jgi:hypothetical protein